jgi:hypothetical protein
VRKKFTAEEKLTELATAYDAVIGLLHSSYLSDDTRHKAETLLKELATEINQLRVTKGLAA